MAGVVGMDMEGKEAQKEGGARQRRALSDSGAAEPWGALLQQGSGGQGFALRRAQPLAGPPGNAYL